MTYEAYYDTDAIRGWYRVDDSCIKGDPEIGIKAGLLRRYSPPTLIAINTAISTDTTLSDNAKHALIELMRVAYEEVIKNSAP